MILGYLIDRRASPVVSPIVTDVLQSTGTVIAPEFLPTAVTSGDIRQPASEANGEEQDVRGLAYDLRQFIKSRLDAKSSNIHAETVEMMERYLLTEILEIAEGNQSEASRILGITRGSLRHKIRSLGITIGSKVNPGE